MVFGSTNLGARLRGWNNDNDDVDNSNNNLQYHDDTEIVLNRYKMQQSDRRSAHQKYYR